MGIAHQVVTVAAGLWVALLAPGVMAAKNDDVEAAIQKAKGYLYSQQHNGNWELGKPRDMRDGTNNLAGGQWGGLTALATYALLTAGENPGDPKLAPAIEFLKREELRGTYALGCRCMVWLRLPRSPENLAAAKRDGMTLVAMMKTQGTARGFYDYVDSPKSMQYSHSRSQYAVLGVWAASQVGVPIPSDYWAAVENGWRSHQDAGGGWTYKAVKETEIPVTPGMTAVGVATLFITQEYLHAMEGIQPRGNVTNPSIEKGLAWMAEHIDEVGKPGKTGREFPHSTWYAVERIGVASGHKYLGKVDWYQKGSDWLVGRQKPDGSWLGEGNANFEGVPTTSFGTLFLARGRAPVMMNKLEYNVAEKGESKVGPWNQRPRDVANLAFWAGGKMERDLNWQIVNLSVPVEELGDAPVLYISGSAALAFTDEEKGKLKRYIEDGGIILGNPDGGAAPFTSSFTALGEELFPGRKFAELAEAHPIYTNQQFPRSKWRNKPSVLALTNGARVLMVTAPGMPGDLAKQWQLNGSKTREDAFQFPADLFLYAVDRQNLQYKGERVALKLDGAKQAKKTIAVARLQYEGNWDPEPGGWRRLAIAMHNERGIDLKITAVKLGDGKLDKSSAVAHLTGTGEVKFTEGQRAELKKYVGEGGQLIIDAAGGQLAFAESIERELGEIFGPEAAKAMGSRLPPDAAVYQKLGAVAEKPDYRSFVRIRTGSLPRTLSLRGYEVNGKLGVIYSPEDISVGLVGQAVDGIHGYSPKTATALMAGLLAGE